MRFGPSPLRTDHAPPKHSNERQGEGFHPKPGSIEDNQIESAWDACMCVWHVWCMCYALCGLCAMCVVRRRRACYLCNKKSERSSVLSQRKILWHAESTIGFVTSGPNAM